MGTYFSYVNETKRELFSIDPTGAYIKRSFIGYSFGSRAFGFLILENDPFYTGLEHEMIGSWIGDRVYITGDDYDARLNEMKKTYADIGPKILEMMSVVAPWDFLKCADDDWLIQFATSGTMADSVRRRLLELFRQARRDGAGSPAGGDLDAVILALRPIDEQAETG